MTNMRFVQLESGVVTYILPADLSEQYKKLPSGSVEIAADTDVKVGDIYSHGIFTTPAPIPIEELSLQEEPIEVAEPTETVQDVLARLEAKIDLLIAGKE